MKQKWLIVAVLAVLTAGGVGYFAGRSADAPGTVSSSSGESREFTCPMHPFIINDRPGTCPICAMDLVRKVEGAGISEKELRELSHVALSPNQQIMANLATVAAEVKPVSRDISCTGIVAYDQERLGKVAAWISGRLDRLRVKSIGAEVRKNRPVAEMYSVDLRNFQEEYLLAHKTTKLLNSTISVSFPMNAQQSLGDASERLRRLGFTEEQFAQLEKSEKPSVRIPIRSPLSGVVTEIFVQEGQYVKEGDTLFSIADLSQVWVELEVHEGDLALVKKGHEVAISSKSYPGRLFHGRVCYIYPFLNPKTRTVKVRVSLPNPGLLLKPDMFVTAVIKVPLDDSLVVPAGAVMDTGKRQLVWVESNPGVFVAREVKMGVRCGAGVQIIAGIRAGEKIAATGAYLIDSEAQLSRGGEVTAQPVTAAEMKDDLDMTGMKMKRGADAPRVK